MIPPESPFHQLSGNIGGWGSEVPDSQKSRRIPSTSHKLSKEHHATSGGGGWLLLKLGISQIEAVKGETMAKFSEAGKKYAAKNLDKILKCGQKLSQNFKMRPETLTKF